MVNNRTTRQRTSIPRQFEQDFIGVSMVALIAGMLATAPVAAADGAASGLDPAATAQGPQHPAAHRMDPISVTATRNPIRAFEYPGMVTIIGPEAIQERVPSKPADILRTVPGVEFFGGPRRTGEVPSIRGFSGPDVVINLDGARQNFVSGHDGRFFIDPSLLREVEVLRGSASSLYGSGGLGGVLEFRTIDAADILDPGTRFGLQASIGRQDANRELVGTLTGATRPTDALDAVASITRRSSGTIRLGDGTNLDAADDDIVSGLVKGSYRVAPSHSVDAAFVFFRNDAEEPNNAQGDGGADIVDKRIRNYTARIGYRYANPANPFLDLDAVAYFNRAKVDELRLDDRGVGPAGELLTREVDTIGFRADNRSRLDLGESAGVVFTYGIEAYRDDQTGQSAAGPRGGVPDADTTFFGGFAQGEITLSQLFGVIPGDILVIPGARWDHFSSSSDVADRSSDSRWSPRIGVSYLPTPWSLLFANYGQGFRAPSVNELFASGVHFRIPIGPGIVNRFVPNPDLRPQRTTTWEAGAGIDFEDVLGPGDRFQVKGSRYVTRGTDFIDLQVNQPTPFVDCNPFFPPGSCDGTTTAANVGRAKLRGTEVEAVYDHPRARLAVNYAWIDGKDRDTGERLGVLF
ncbi:MAG: TonB-dependent receptor, partial [Rhodospirillales bacterium]